MKTRIAILLASVLLAQAFSPFLRQLGKIPALALHYFSHHHHEHHAHGDALSLGDFLAQHYGNRPHHDDAGKDHSNLPFHCSEVSAAGLLPALPAAAPSLELSLAPRSGRQALLSHPAFYSNLFVPDIFRPPLL